MLNILAHDISVGSWLKYALISMPNHLVTVIPILLVSFAFLLLMVGIIWGKLWNKKWSLTSSPLRIFCVIGCSLMAALSLAAADIVQSNGSIFQSNMGPAIKQLSPNENNEISITPEDAAYAFLKGVVQAVESENKAMDDMMDDDPSANATQSADGLVLTPASISSYSASIMFLWGIFGVCTIMLFAGVALAGYSDIKEVKPIA